MAEREVGTVLEVSRTHLFPGARGRIEGRGGACMVVFSDGARAFGTLDETGGLAVGAYRTAAGTAIGAKRWSLALDGEAFRVTGRLG